MENKSTAPAKGSASTENSLGLKGFNQTGREETTTQVLRPQRDPRFMQRNAALIGIVVVAVFVICYMGYKRSGLSLSDINAPTTSSFGTGHAEQNFNKNE